MEATKENVKDLQQLAVSSKYNEELINDAQQEKLYLSRDISQKILQFLIKRKNIYVDRDISMKILPFLITNDTELTVDNCPIRLKMKDVKLRYRNIHDYQVHYAWYIFNIDDEIVHSKRFCKMYELIRHHQSYTYDILWKNDNNNYGICVIPPNNDSDLDFNDERLRRNNVRYICDVIFEKDNIFRPDGRTICYIATIEIKQKILCEDDDEDDHDDDDDDEDDE